MEQTENNTDDSFESYLEGLRSLILVYDTEPNIDTKSKVSDACKALIELLPSNSESVQLIILETLIKIENENFATFKELFIRNRISLVLIDLIINNENTSIREVAFQIIKIASRKLGESDQVFNSILIANLSLFLNLLRNFRINDNGSKTSVMSIEYILLQLVVLMSSKKYSYELFKKTKVLEIVVPYLSVKSYPVNQKVCELLINMSYRGEPEVIDEFINLNLLPDLIRILQLETVDDGQETAIVSNLQLCVLYVFANITRGSVTQNQKILSFGLLKVLSKFLIIRSTFSFNNNSKKTNNSVITTKIIESSSVIISNLSRDPDTSDMIVKQNILPYICRILESESSPIKVKMKLIFFFSNLVKGAENRTLVANYKIISLVEPVLNLFENKGINLDLEDMVDTYSNVLDICLYVVISNKYQKQFFFKKNVLNGLFPIFSLPTHPAKFSPQKIYLLKKNFIKFLLLLSKNVKEFNYQMLNGTLIIEKLAKVLTNLVEHHKFKNTEDEMTIENSLSTISAGSPSLAELSTSSEILNSSFRNHGYNNVDNDRSASATPDSVSTSRFASPAIQPSEFSSGMILVDQSSNTSSETDIFDMLTIIYSVVLNCKTEYEQKRIIVSKVDLFKILLEFIDVRYSFKIKYITCELLTILLKIDKELTNLKGQNHQAVSPLTADGNDTYEGKNYISFFDIIDKKHIMKLMYFFNCDDNGAEIDYQIISIISYLFAKYNVDALNNYNVNYNDNGENQNTSNNKENTNYSGNDDNVDNNKNGNRNNNLHSKNEKLFEWFSILLGPTVMNSLNKFLQKLLSIMGKRVNISKSSNYPIINNVNIIFNSLFSLKAHKLMELISKEQIASIIDFFKNLIALLTSKLSKPETYTLMNTPISGSSSATFKSLDMSSDFEGTDSIADSDSVNISLLSISQGSVLNSNISNTNSNNGGSNIKDSMIIKTTELSIRTLEKFSMISNKEKQMLVGSNILGILAVFAFSLKELFGSMRSQKRLAQNLKLMSIITRLFCEIANGSDQQRLALCSKYNILPFAVTTLTIPNSILAEGNEIVILKTNVVTLLENLSSTHSDKITDMILKMGLIQCLVEFLDEKGYNSVFRLHVVNALSNFASSNNEYLKDLQIDLGIFNMLFKILEQLIKKSDIINENKHFDLQDINNKEKYNQGNFSLKHLILYYGSLESNETVVNILLICSILNLLTNLTNTNSKNTLQIVNAGFLPLFFELVSSSDLYVLEKTCKVIRNISNGGVNHCKAIISNYLIIPLNTLFESNHGNEAERKLVEQRLLQYRYISNEEINKLRKTMDVHIVWIFANVSRFEDTQRLTTLNSGVLNTLPQVMTLNGIASKEDKSLQKAIISLLHNLIYSKECLTIIIYDYSELISSIIRLLLTYNKNDKEENELIVLLLNFMLLVSQVEDMKYRRFLVEQNLLGVVNKFKDSDAMVVKTLTLEIGSNLTGSR